MLRVGLISDTHVLSGPEAFAFLEGSDHIIHGGDICDGGVLEALSGIAPVTAVRGNNDHGSWASRLRKTERFRSVKSSSMRSMISRSSTWSQMRPAFKSSCQAIRTGRWWSGGIGFCM